MISFVLYRWNETSVRIFHVGGFWQKCDLIIQIGFDHARGVGQVFVFRVRGARARYAVGWIVKSVGRNIP